MIQIQSLEYNDLLKQMKAQLQAGNSVNEKTSERYPASAEVQLILESGEKSKIEYHTGKLKDFNVTSWSKVGIAIISDGIQSYASTEDLRAESLMKTFARALANLSFLKKNSRSSPNLHFYPQQTGVKEIPELYFEEDISIEAQKNLAFQLEDLTLKCDPRVAAVISSGFIENKYHLRILNSLGLDQSCRQRLFSAYVQPMLKDKNFAKTDRAISCSRRFKEINVSELAEFSINRAGALLGAQVPASGHYAVVVDKEVTPLFIQMLTHCFSAIEVDKKTSLFKDQLNKKIASVKINLIDDPFDIRGVNSRPFDSEGMPSQRHTLIEQGILKKFLTNKEYAEKLNLEHTAHASRRSSGETDIEPSNLFIEKGSLKLVDLLNRYPKAIYVTKFAGSFHGGYKETTGDFSLPCEGFFIEGGEKKGPLDQFVVSGNVLDTLMQIEDISDTYGKLNYTFWGPDLLISSLSVAGK
jgi:PmbA protein